METEKYLLSLNIEGEDVQVEVSDLETANILLNGRYNDKLLNIKKPVPLSNKNLSEFVGFTYYFCF